MKLAWWKNRIFGRKNVENTSTFFKPLWWGSKLGTVVKISNSRGQDILRRAGTFPAYVKCRRRSMMMESITENSSSTFWAEILMLVRPSIMKRIRMTVLHYKEVQSLQSFTQDRSIKSSWLVQSLDEFLSGMGLSRTGTHPVESKFSARIHNHNDFFCIVSFPTCNTKASLLFSQHHLLSFLKLNAQSLERIF